jgi:hypothetical protein
MVLTLLAVDTSFDSIDVVNSAVDTPFDSVGIVNSAVDNLPIMLTLLIQQQEAFLSAYNKFQLLAAAFLEPSRSVRQNRHQLQRKQSGCNDEQDTQVIEA